MTTPDPVLDSGTKPSIRVVDARRDAANILVELREKLSPRGDLVSPSGRQLTQRVFGSALTPVEVVDRICRDVQADGLKAVLRYTASLDGADLNGDTIRVTADEFAAAHAAADDEILRSVRRIRDNIVEFQRAILHQDVTIEPRTGVKLTQRYLPLPRVGVCIPGGAAAYPSSVLMTVVPAQVAGVDQIAVMAPPTPFGSYNTDLLATCHELGVTEVYRMGGAQGVAALAHGCESIPAVDKIVGPGNMFVALAKKHVFGTVDIDSFAGPSEVIVIADHSADPNFIAIDLLAQAEHSPGSAILITTDETMPARVQASVDNWMERLSRADLLAPSLEQFSAMIIARDEQHACELTDSFAPEHLHIQTVDPNAMIARIRHSGAAFLGHHTPVALGDYAAGPSHVLPTGGTCRWAAGLCSNSFLRPGSVTTFTSTATAAIAADVITLAEREGLTSHAESVRVRVNADRPSSGRNQ